MQVITTHRNTDFDALASVVAAMTLFPEAIVVLPRSINPNVKAFLSIHKDLYGFHLRQEIDIDKVTQLIVVDTNQWSRIARRLQPLKNRTDINIYLWDHHAQAGDIQANFSCQEPLGANISLILRQLRKDKHPLTPMTSTLMLIALYEDTGHLTYPSTTPEDAYTAAYLLEQCADLNILGTFLSPAYGEKQKEILFEMLKQPKKLHVKEFTISFSTQTISGHVDRLSLVVQLYREIINVDAAFGIFIRDENRYIVIGRSNREDINVGSIMKSIGGGGHPGAGSAMLTSTNAETIQSMILELIEGNQQSSVKVADLMSFPVFSIPSNTKMDEVAKILEEKECKGVPIIDDGIMVGIISRRDFVKLKKKSQWRAPVKAFMSRDIKTVAPDNSPLQAAKIMVRHDIGRLPVVDENGVTIGIVSRSDAMMYFYDLLPE
ncbi:MAG: tRNA nucleotidyltransferase (CCA-adding enzyme) [Candidatus Magnetoglobus multicellularis str. Araruama]|uniref:tRNA nucleotidyltransferase (CCA-adding enzyme) n=1 Tax=Candidatus Magnetoglobus multicellularis str. Araruama TaxID=890399 RepID=A0A1V1P6P5_9BACT|nr:MAG: tRNA nucleotidyltransferase (CCA-adding enzyme) [Candidatus Magnetoglobus multicellularis str. Araruama]